MNVSLTPELEALVHERVGSGRYASASEVVREALRLLADRDELRDLRLRELRGQVAHGLSAVTAGDVYAGEAVFDAILGGGDSTRSRA